MHVIIMYFFVFVQATVGYFNLMNESMQTVPLKVGCTCKHAVRCSTRHMCTDWGFLERWCSACCVYELWISRFSLQHCYRASPYRQSLSSLLHWRPAHKSAIIQITKHTIWKSLHCALCLSVCLSVHTSVMCLPVIHQHSTESHSDYFSERKPWQHYTLDRTTNFGVGTLCGSRQVWDAAKPQIDDDWW